MIRRIVLAAGCSALTASTAAAQQPSIKPLSPAAQELGKQVRQAQERVEQATADVEVRARAEEMIEKAEAYLRSRQDKQTGGWSASPPAKEGEPARPQIPAITALVINGMLMDDKADPAKDESIRRGLDFILSYQQPDGGIYDKILPNYNTSLAVSALSKVHAPKYKDAMDRAVAFLKTLQWSEQADPGVGGKEAPKPVGKDHPFYGGMGYGKDGRPDNSNMTMFLQALQDAGVSPSDEAVKRALVFLQRTQMDDRVNTEQYAKGSRQGGFIYSTVENAESVEGRAGQSQAGTVEETLSDGTVASRLRCYGTMSYAGFKAYVYAQLAKDDVRVVAAHDWIRRNYTVDENPGIASAGLYYYYVVFARALNAWGEPTVRTLDAHNAPTGQSRNWRMDLVNKLAAMQNEDGSFKSVNRRWMEDNPELITAYAVLALREAVAD